MANQTDKITNRDILKFLHNAQLYSAEPVSKERVDVLAVWGNAIKQELQRWLDIDEEFELYPNTHELIFVLISVAYELQDQIMRKENQRCKPKDSKDIKSSLESCLK